MFVDYQKCFVLCYFSKRLTYHYFLGDTPVSSADSVSRIDQINTFPMIKSVDNVDWADFFKLSHYSAT